MAKNINQVFENKVGQAAILPRKIVTDFSNIPDFDDILKELLIPTKQKEEEEKRYILVEKRIDQYNLLRSRKLITKTTCIECAFDILEHFNYKNKTNLVFDELSEEQKSGVLEALHKHIEIYHPIHSKKIITESELIDFDKF